jgi:hypothetical protein
MTANPLRRGVHSARRLLRARPRLLLTIALAFALETLRPVAPTIWHQHPGGEHTHVHAPGELSAATHRHPATATEAGPRDTRPGLREAPASDGHLHVVRPLHPVVVPELAPLAPDLPFVPIPDPVAPDLGVVTPAHASARGPPFAHS